MAAMLGAGRQTRTAIFGLALALAALSGCAGSGKRVDTPDPGQEVADSLTYGDRARPRSRLGDYLFRNRQTDRIGQVNKYLWQATLDVLDFLPVEEVDPFTGVIVTGYGTPPGGGRPYRATVLISDPALDARSLNVALYSRSGPVSEATRKAVEDAILARARQLRKRDSRF